MMSASSGRRWTLGGYAHAIRKKVVKFNGEFFLRRTVLPLGREEIGELRRAASAMTGATSTPRFSARCSNRRWTRTSGGASARIIRLAPMSSVSSSPR